ncbi:hypothetical protein KKG44_04280 [Patescibacteria group bacterium]|nr:hypothetical protein [Patescibacteria group bacterium]
MATPRELVGDGLKNSAWMAAVLLLTEACSTVSPPEALTIEQATQALDAWRQFITTEATTYTMTAPVGLLAEASDPTRLITLSPIVDGKADASVQWAVGFGTWQNMKTGEKENHSVFLRRQNGQVQVFGLFGIAEHTDTKTVFTASTLESGILRDAQMQVEIVVSPDGSTIAVRDTKTAGTVFLTETPSQSSATPSATDVPRPVIDKLVEVASGAKPAQAAGEETLVEATQEPTKESTNTPELAKPVVSHNLSAENAKTMVVEGGTWVVKNAAGQITATYIPETGWVYEWEKIKVEQALLIYGNGNMTIEVDQSLMALPEYDSSKALIMNGNPIKDGVVIFSKINMTGGQEVNWDQDVALISARIIGATKLDTVTINRKQVDRYLLSYGIQLSPDKKVILVSVVEDGGETRIFVLPNGDVTNVNINQIAPEHVRLIGIPTHDLISQIQAGALNNQQVLLYVAYNFPSWHHRVVENQVRKILIETIQSGEIPPSTISISTSPSGIGTSLAMPEAIIP